MSKTPAEILKETGISFLESLINFGHYHEGMATGTLVSVETYLHTVYEPDCDYVDGEVIERNVGEYPHSSLQAALAAYIYKRRKKWGVVPLTEQRIRIRERKYLIPDVCAVKPQERGTKILSDPPLIWIEILSSEDRPIRIERKIRDVIDFGTPYVWVIDPETLESYVVTQSSRYELLDGIFRIEGTDIVVPLRELEED